MVRDAGITGQIAPRHRRVSGLAVAAVHIRDDEPACIGCFTESQGELSDVRIALSCARSRR